VNKYIALFIFVLLGVIFYEAVHYQKKDDSKFYEKEIKIAYDLVHSLDSVNSILQDSLNQKLDTVYISKTKTKHHYDTIFISIDNLGADSASKLLSNNLDRYADTNFTEINNGF
jgi:hypothetical protein